MNKKILKVTVIFMAFVLFVGVVYALTLIEWTEVIPVIEQPILNVVWSGNAIVGEPITITVTITTQSEVTGNLLVEVYEGDKTTLDQELYSGAITVSTTGFTDSYTWTANLGDHYGKATFEA